MRAEVWLLPIVFAKILLENPFSSRNNAETQSVRSEELQLQERHHSEDTCSILYSETHLNRPVVINLDTRRFPRKTPLKYGFRLYYDVPNSLPIYFFNNNIVIHDWIEFSINLLNRCVILANIENILKCSSNDLSFCKVQYILIIIIENSFGLH